MLEGWGAHQLLAVEERGRKKGLEGNWEREGCWELFLPLLAMLLLLAVTLASLKDSSSARRYKKYVFLDPLAGAVTKTHVALETETEEKLFDAPLSITERGQLDRQVRCSCRTAATSPARGCTEFPERKGLL